MDVTGWLEFSMDGWMDVWLGWMVDIVGYGRFSCYSMLF